MGLTLSLDDCLAPGELALNTLPPLSLYVHFPWCERKCPYCDFNSHETKPTNTQQQHYIEALKADLMSMLPYVWGRPVVSIFMGGGTPSLIAPELIDDCLSFIRATLSLLPGAEITLEANPASSDEYRFKALHEAGVNRLSLGVQSFDNRYLQALGRLHTRDDVHESIQAAQKNFARFNIDLMFGLPQQTIKDLEQDIDTLLQYQPTHVSYYQLTLEAQTHFAQNPPQGLPTSDVAADMQDLVAKRLTNHGLQRYEVSAYAQKNQRAQHNLNYWCFGDYLGIGAGAHSKLSFPHRIVRQMRYRQPDMYMDQALVGNAVLEVHEVTTEQLPFEFMLNALRLQEGVGAYLFEQRTGLGMHVVSKLVQKAQDQGFLVDDHAVIQPTPLGWRFLNDVQAMFLDVENPRRVISLHQDQG